MAAVPESESVSVTVVIPTFNQAQYLQEAVRSATQQSWQPVAVLIGDDASTDHTFSVGTRLAQCDSRVRYIRYTDNRGIAGNTSRLMAQAESEFVLRLDSDDALEPTFVETLVPMMRKHPQAAYGHGAATIIDQTGNRINESFLNRTSEFVDGEYALRAAVRGYRVAANIILYRRIALEEMNYFRGRPNFCSDSDIAARLAAAGWGNVYADRLLARYRVWTDSAGARARRKHDELEGYIRIYNEVFTPAFAARGWSARPLIRQRKLLALTHANFCFLPHHTPQEQEQLTCRLQELGDSTVLQLKLILLRHGFAPAFERFLHMRGNFKKFVKKELAKWRARKHPCPK